MIRERIRHTTLMALLCVFVVSGGVGQERTEVQQLIQRLYSTDHFVRELAAEELAGLGDEAAVAVPALIALLQDEDENVRRMVAYALGKLGADSEEAEAALIRALEDPDYGVRWQAIRAVAGFGVSAIPRLMQVFDGFRIDPENEFSIDATAFSSATAALAEMGEAAIPYLRDALGQSVNRATGAASALRLLGPGGERAVPELVKALEHEDVELRRVAASALGAIGAAASELALPALIRALEDDGFLVGSEAASALARMGPRAAEAVPALERALESSNRYTRQAAERALRKINEQ